MINNTIQLNKVTLTVNEEIGFQFEGLVSDRLTLLGIEHDEFPHLFREDFKRNIRKGVDFPNLRINDVTVDLEAKRWSRVFPCWLDKVTDRFEGSTADYKIAVVDNYLKAGWNKIRMLLLEHSIIPMSIRALTKFIQKLKKKQHKPKPRNKERGCNYSTYNIVYSSFNFPSLLCSILGSALGNLRNFIEDMVRNREKDNLGTDSINDLAYQRYPYTFRESYFSHIFTPKNIGFLPFHMSLLSPIQKMKQINSKRYLLFTKKLLNLISYIRTLYVCCIACNLLHYNTKGRTL